MADGKRNSVAGKIATPKGPSATNAQPMLDTLEALGKAIGAKYAGLTFRRPQVVH